MKALLLILLAAGCACAQTTANLTETFNGQTASVAFTILPPTQLAVSPSVTTVSTPAGKTVNFDLAMTSTCSSARPTCLQPASLQLLMQAPSTGVSGFTVTEGPAATAASKTWSCAVQTVPSITATKCILAAVNQTTIANGVIAHVAVAVPPAATGSPAVTLSALSAANAFANAMQGTASGSVAVTVLPTLGLVCAQGFIEPGEVVVCTASLSGSSASSTTVTLATDHATSPGLVVPASVVVAANATSQAFNVTGQ